jgi:hypothetical protein
MPRKPTALPMCSIVAFTRMSKPRLQRPGGRRIELRTSMSGGGWVELELRTSVFKGQRGRPGSKVRGVPPASSSPLPPCPPGRRPARRRPSCAACWRSMRVMSRIRSFSFAVKVPDHFPILTAFSKGGGGLLTYNIVRPDKIYAY